MSILDKPVPYLKTCFNKNFSIGLTIALVVVLVALKWQFYVAPDFLVDLDVVWDNTDWVTVMPMEEPIQEEEKKPDEPKKEPVVLQNIVPVANIINIPTPKIDLSAAMSSIKAVFIPEPTPDTNVVFQVVEHMPEFPGGPQALIDYLRTIPYCNWAQEAGEEGTIHASFVVNEKGNVEDVKILRGLFPCLDNAVVSYINAMPDWKPGIQGNRAVKVRQIVPVKFTLN